MSTIKIDLSQFGRGPCGHSLGTWTFIIDGEAVDLYGSYAEAAVLARLYVRLSGLDAGSVSLTGHAPSGRVHTNLN